MTSFQILRYEHQASLQLNTKSPEHSQNHFGKLSGKCSIRFKIRKPLDGKKQV